MNHLFTHRQIPFTPRLEYDLGRPLRVDDLPSLSWDDVAEPALLTVAGPAAVGAADVRRATAAEQAAGRSVQHEHVTLAAPPARHVPDDRVPVPAQRAGPRSPADPHALHRGSLAKMCFDKSTVSGGIGLTLLTTPPPYRWRPHADGGGGTRPVLNDPNDPNRFPRSPPSQRPVGVDGGTPFGWFGGDPAHRVQLLPGHDDVNPERSHASEPCSLARRGRTQPDPEPHLAARTRVPLVGQAPLGSAPPSRFWLIGRSPTSSHQAVYAAYRSRAVARTCRPSPATHASATNSPIESISVRYPSVASTTASGVASPSRRHARHPATSHARIPSASACSLAGSDVLLTVADPLDERDDPDPPPEPVVRPADQRPVVRVQEHLMRRRELEEVLPHEPGLHPRLADQVLQLGLVEPAALVRLAADDEPPADQVRDVRRVRRVVVGGQQVAVGLARVVAQRVGDGVEQRRLAVRAGAVQEEQDLLGRQPGAPVPQRPLDVADQGRVGAERAGEERREDRGSSSPARTRPGTASSAGTGAAVGAEAAGAEFDRAVAAVQQPRVGVELVGRHGQLGLGQLQHRGEAVRRAWLRSAHLTSSRRRSPSGSPAASA